MTIGLGEGVGVAEMVVNGSRGFKITGSGMSRGTAPSITWRHFVGGKGCVSNCQDNIEINLRGEKMAFQNLLEHLEHNKAHDLWQLLAN